MSVFGPENRIPNPSFEVQAPVYWSLGGEAEITDVYGAYTGMRALYLDQQYTEFGPGLPTHTFSSARVDFWNLRTDRTYTLRHRLMLYAVTGSQSHTVALSLDTTGNGALDLNLPVYFEDDFTVGEWTLQEHTGITFTATAGWMQVLANLPPTVDARTRWLVDDFELVPEDPAPDPPAVGEDITLPGTRPWPKVGFRNAHVDSLHGTLIDEPDVAHDRHDRTRHINDIGQLDRDEQDRPIRHEDPPPEP